MDAFGLDMVATFLYLYTYRSELGCQELNRKVGALLIKLIVKQ